MLNKYFFNRKLKNNSPGNTGNPLHILNRPASLGILAFAALAILFSILIYQRYQLLQQAKKREAYEIVNTAKDKLQDVLSYSASATKILSFFIDNNGNVKNFDSVAAQIINTNKDIDAMELVPDGVIRYIYPLKGNEAALGFDILKDSSRSKEAFKAIERKELFFSGPFKLKQGGEGIVGRLPVFRNKKFWGFSAVILKLPVLLKAAGIESPDINGNYFQLSKINPDTQKEEFFIQQDEMPSRDYITSVDLPNGEWKLSVMPASGYRRLADIFILALLGFVISILGGIFVFTEAGRPKRLDQLVKERTWQLKESDERFSKAFHSNVVGFAIYDSDFRIVDINEPYAHILESSRENLIGKTSDEAGLISKINSGKRENISKEIEVLLNTYGQLQHYETEIETNDGEPATILLSIEPLELNHKAHWLTSVIDITASKKAELLMKESEEKYRTLIEQASDGIVITDLDGNILEVNNSICAMSGYSEPEMLGEHLYKFLPAEDAVLNPLRFRELMEGKSLLYERRLLKKDGTVLEIEVNSKMASSHTMIGFMRDISERKKSEETLRYQARLLESVTDAVTSLDIDRRVVSWNKASEELYGFKPEVALGKRIPELVAFEFPGITTEDVFKQVYSQGRWKGEFNFIHPHAGIKTFLLSSINTLKNKEGNITGFIITSKDITDRKKAEEEMRKSNERFELIAQATNDAVWDHDFDKNETWGNKKLYDLYGFEPGTEKINFEMFLGQIHPDEKDKVEDRMNMAISNAETVLSEEFRFKTVNGKYRNFYDRAYIKYNEEGKPLRILGAMEDITDREIIKKQILKEKELADSIINSLPGVFYLYNQQGKFLRWNKNFEAVTGYSGEEISHMHPTDFFDEEEKELLARKIANVFVTGSDNVEANFYLKNKQKVPYYFTGQAIEYEGETCLMGVGLDFSEKEEAAKIIRESEEKYRTLVEQASDGIFIADKQGRFLVVNSSGYHMSQYSEDELKKLSIYDLVLPDDIKKDPFHFSEMQGGRVASAERRMKRKDGTILDVEVTAKFISGERFLAFVRDVSERKKADRALRESEERYRALVENAPEALVVFDVEKRGFVSVSESATKLFGMTADELLKIGPVEVSPQYQPNGKLSAEAAVENIGKAINGEKPSFEWTHCNKQGDLIPCQVWLVRLPAENAVLIRGSIIDITERKKAEEELQQSEQKYRLLFYNNPLPMWMTTIPGLDIIDVNDAAIRQYGYTRGEFLKMNTRDLRPAEDVENFLKEVDKMEPGVINIRAWRHKKKDGIIIHVETYSHQIMYEGRLVWLGLSHDVTEQYNAKELLQKSYEEIRQLASNLQSIREDERTNIAREIHDELGQQLTGLKMDIHWLSRKIKNTDAEIHDKMKESMELINATITSVRKIATDLRPSILDDLGLLAALEWQGEEFEKRSGTKVSFVNKAGDLLVKPGVATAIFRIYQELLTNIARHANAELVTASLYINKNTLYFSIKDDGVGFNMDTIGSKKTLGLLGIKERTLLMGGTYQIKTNPGEGSETIISIPLDLIKITG